MHVQIDLTGLQLADQPFGDIHRKSGTSQGDQEFAVRNGLLRTGGADNADFFHALTDQRSSLGVVCLDIKGSHPGVFDALQTFGDAVGCFTISDEGNIVFQIWLPSLSRHFVGAVLQTIKAK